MKKLLVAVALLISVASIAQTYEPNWKNLDTRPIPEWYRNGKFGIFIHWGVYSVPAYCEKGSYAEWYQYGLMHGDTARLRFHKEKFGNRTYYDLANDFKAELYNPDEWARVIEASGAKYVVLTSKHHDGFCNWPSKDASRDWGFAWNSVDAGPHRDLLGDLFTAIRKTSVHAGMYYSLYEWFNPLWLKNREKYVSDHMWPQMKDLVNTYKPDVFWTDGDWDASDTLWKSCQFLAWLYNESPVKDKVVTYDRWGSGVRFHHGEVFTPEYQPELSFANHYWEENRGMGFSYGYNREEDAWDYNSAQSLVLQLIDKVSRGGNFLLDIGPDEHGKIPPIMQERLLQIGDWMKINNEAIYNTAAWRSASQWGEGNRNYRPKNSSGDLLLKLTIDPDPGYAVKECFFTYNPASNNLYVLLPKYPSGRKFTIHDLLLPANTKMELLETHDALSWHQEGNDLVIQLPGFDPNRIRSQYAFVIKINNVGAFAPATNFSIDYIGNSLKPEVTLSSGPGTEIRYTLDGSVPDEHSTLYAKPFTVDESSKLSARAFVAGKMPGNVATSSLEVYSWKDPEPAGSLHKGLKLRKYALNSPTTVNDIDKASAAVVATATSISIQDTLRSENTGLVYEGFIKIPHDALYHFYLKSDDGSVLWVDGKKIIDNDGLHGDEEAFAGMEALKKGYHSFKLSFIQASGQSGLSLQCATGQGKRQDIPAAWLFSHP
ncbi:MAG TPA: alpha-L-fucosidase [Puia sp.]|nr:alpha-L-fucosidase [Puia sp.]